MDELDEIKNFVFHTGIQQSVTFKFVILDEADLIPKDLQSAFRRIIEMAPPNVKFIFMCNYVENMIDPILFDANLPILSLTPGSVSKSH